MDAALELFGIDTTSLVQQLRDFPDPVKGRVAHIDADFLAYQMSYEKEDEPKKLEDIYDHVLKAVDDLRKLAGAETAVLHLTPKGSDKGNRDNLAVIKEYQSTRSREKPRYLHVIRDWMGDLDIPRVKGKLHFHCEADDGMSSAQWAAINRGEMDLSVIVSKDKDLRMVPGNHLNWDTGELEGITDGTTYGFIEWNVAKKKIVGYGTKFFWAQMLMGDAADTIWGLPSIAPVHVAKYLPTKAYTAAKDKAVALKKITHKPCGPKAAFDLLENVDTEKAARELVVDLYREGNYKHWETGDAVTWHAAFLSNAYLLWMRKEPENQHCVHNFLKEIGSE